MTMKTIRDTLATPFNRFAGRIVAALAAYGLLGAAEALAQSGVGPARPQKPEEPPMFLYYGVFAVLALATIGASVIPSKRGHLD